METNFICPVCGKEHCTEMTLYRGIEVCNHCFETIVRVSRFAKLTNATPEELEILHNWLEAELNDEFPPEVDVKKLKESYDD